nr:MAG TPA: hypothetical protein [Caudoviricetes sp.]
MQPFLFSLTLTILCVFQPKCELYPVQWSHENVIHTRYSG